MQSQTLGLNHNKRRSLKPSVRNKVVSLRKQGMTCEEIAKVTGVGRSTIARYTSDWYQKHANQSNTKRGRRKSNAIKEAVKATVVKAAPKAAAVQKPKKQDGLQPLSPEVVSYINSIYASRPTTAGNPIGNFIIKLGKFLGGHNSI